ncbi:hypothetical protein DSO57_1004451 [Entomophthora muscae]|nr:hypothetical protein DSO57_1004451 [Entomophthora muscae]
MGMTMSSWYDVYSLNNIDQEQDEKGMLESVQKVNQFIQAEIDAGIPANRIVIGGFSQGCVVSLLTMLKSERSFAGMIGLSGYLPLHKKISSMASEASKKTPIFWGHGESDEIVAFHLGKMTNEYLSKAGYQIEFNAYPGMAHSACNEEIVAMSHFLSNVLPPTDS